VKYLLDTDTLSSLMRPEPSVRLQARLAKAPVADQATSSITLGELLFGCERVGGRRGMYLRELVEARAVANLEILPFDEQAARHYAELRAHLERVGTPIGDADTRIAAIALARGLAVVIGNTRHFDRVPGLPVENWLA
jgi:tRNA(fMet)-specific endonuclease VapC